MRGRVGVFGGTFNPIHNAHISIARAALEQFGLSTVLLIPNGIPPDAAGAIRPGKEDRYRMVAAAVANEERLKASRIEVDREGRSYTIDTIRALQEDYPQGICFIVGADCLLQIETWKEPKAILASVPIVVAPRGDATIEALDKAPFDEAEIFFLDMPTVDVSSTGLRERVARGESIEEWVPTPVAAYIEEHGLYRDADEA